MYSAVSYTHLGTKQLDAKKIDIRSNLCYPFRNLTNEPGEFKPVYAFNGSEVITADPLFSDYANAGFHLKKGSPAINQSFPGGILGALPTVRETNNQTNK